MRFSVTVLLLWWMAPTALADTWSGFQNGGNISLSRGASPRIEWTIESGIAWDLALAGYGQSSPVVDGHRVYVTSISGGMKENLHVQAVDRASGKELWRYDAKNSSPEKNTGYVSRAAPSPASDAHGVIAFFEGGNVVALTREGDIRWQRDLVADLGPIKVRHGIASSIEQNDRHVFIWVEREEEPYVLALTKNTGKTVWKTEGIGSTTWSSPRLVPVGDADHLVLSGIGKLTGIDPESGKHLWTFDKITGNSTPTPVPLGSGRFLIGATVGRGEPGGGKAARSNGLLEIKKADGDQFTVNYVWRAERATSSFGSPLAYGGHAYFVNRSGVVYCLDLETGKEKYASRTASSVWATPVGIGDRIYLFGKNGTTTVIQSGPEFKQLAENPLWRNEASLAPAEGERRMSSGGPVLYAVALVEGDLILRRGDRLYKIAP